MSAQTDTFKTTGTLDKCQVRQVRLYQSLSVTCFISSKCPPAARTESANPSASAAHCPSTVAVVAALGPHHRPPLARLHPAVPPQAERGAARERQAGPPCYLACCWRSPSASGAKVGSCSNPSLLVPASAHGHLFLRLARSAAPALAPRPPLVLLVRLAPALLVRPPYLPAPLELRPPPRGCRCPRARPAWPHRSPPEAA